jgi:hypothetical protein
MEFTKDLAEQIADGCHAIGLRRRDGSTFPLRKNAGSPKPPPATIRTCSFASFLSISIGQAFRGVTPVSATKLIATMWKAGSIIFQSSPGHEHRLVRSTFRLSY